MGFVVVDELKAQATKQAKDDSKKMHLNVVRLKFQVYLPDASGNYSRLLDPVVSNTVYDSSKLLCFQMNKGKHVMRSGDTRRIDVFRLS